MDEHVLQRTRARATDPERDALLEKHLNLVYHVARRMNRGGGDVEFDELVSAGTMGLIDAIEKFDPDRGLAFSTFAVPRIRGAILDELRRLDTVSRGMRQRQRQMDDARHALTALNGRPPTDEEIAQEIGVEPETLWRWRADSERTQRVSLDAPAVEDDSGVTSLGDVLVDDGADAPDDAIQREELLRGLEAEIARLEPQERTVLGLYYFEELKLREIADILDLTVSRISQVRTGAIRKLRERLSISEEV